MGVKEQIGGDVILADGRKMPLSKAIRVNSMIFVSGQLGLDAKGNIVEGGIEAQTRQALANLKFVLTESGAALDDVVKVTAWLIEREHFGAFNSVYAEHFSETPPARSTVVSGLLLPGALVEIEAIAVMPWNCGK